MLIKRLIIVLLMLLCMSPPSYCDITDVNKEAQKLDNFVAWQKQLNWNTGSQLDYFLDSSSFNMIIPLSGQWEVWTGNGGAELRETTWNANVNTRTSTKKTPWAYNCGEVSTVLFGEKAGASPLIFRNFKPDLCAIWDLKNGA